MYVRARVRESGGEPTCAADFVLPFVFIFIHPRPSGPVTVLLGPPTTNNRYFDNYGTIAKHLAEYIVSIHVGYDVTLLHCWQQVYEAVVAFEPASEGGRKTLSTAGAVGKWFDLHRYDVLETELCP